MMCIECGKYSGSPAGHNWDDATCQSPMTCSECGDTQGIKSDHDWSLGSDDTPRICRYCDLMEPLPLPQSGQVLLGSNLYTRSELTITSSTTDSCYIKLKNSSKEDVFAFFVRAGDTVTVDVPSGNYYVYFSYGNDWYGTEYLFGEETTYSKDDESCDFTNYTWSYTLTPSSGGNFSETPIDEDEFK